GVLAGRRRSRLHFFAVGLLSSLADVDTAFEKCSIFDGDASCHHVAGQGTVAADVYPVAGGQVAAHLAQHHHFASSDVGGDYAVSADSHAVARKIDRTFHPAIYVERLRASYLALDHQRLTDGRLIGGGGCSNSRAIRLGMSFVRCARNGKGV